MVVSINVFLPRMSVLYASKIAFAVPFLRSRRWAAVSVTAPVITANSSAVNASVVSSMVANKAPNVRVVLSLIVVNSSVTPTPP